MPGEEISSDDSGSIFPDISSTCHSIATTAYSVAESFSLLAIDKTLPVIPDLNVSKPPTTFHGFSRLPNQIQLLILRHVTKLARNVELCKGRGGKQFLSPPSPIFQVNRTIRHQLETFYFPDFIITSKPRSDSLHGVDFIQGIWVAMSSPHHTEQKIHFSPDVDQLVVHQEVLQRFFKR